MRTIRRRKMVKFCRRMVRVCLAATIWDNGIGWDGMDGRMNFEQMPRSRPQHYIFAHQAIPQLAHADPARMMRILGGSDAEAFLRQVWDEIGQQGEPNERFEPIGLSVAWVPLPTGHVAGLIVMPDPVAVPEAYFVAVVAPQPTDEGFAPDLRCRVITLERSFTLPLDDLASSSSPATALCEWTADGTHLNFGIGPDPEAEHFAIALTAMLAQGK